MQTVQRWMPLAKLFAVYAYNQSVQKQYLLKCSAIVNGAEAASLSEAWKYLFPWVVGSPTLSDVCLFSLRYDGSCFCLSRRLVSLMRCYNYHVPLDLFTPNKIGFVISLVSFPVDEDEL